MKPSQGKFHPLAIGDHNLADRYGGGFGQFRCA